jgi:hypothetical protein
LPIQLRDPSLQFVFAYFLSARRAIMPSVWSRPEMQGSMMVFGSGAALAAGFGAASQGTLIAIGIGMGAATGGVVVGIGVGLLIICGVKMWRTPRFSMAVMLGGLPEVALACIVRRLNGTGTIVTKLGPYSVSFPKTGKRIMITICNPNASAEDEADAEASEKRKWCLRKRKRSPTNKPVLKGFVEFGDNYGDVAVGSWDNGFMELFSKMHMISKPSLQYAFSTNSWEYEAIVVQCGFQNAEVVAASRPILGGVGAEPKSVSSKAKLHPCTNGVTNTTFESVSCLSGVSRQVPSTAHPIDLGDNHSLHFEHDAYDNPARVVVRANTTDAARTLQNKMKTVFGVGRYRNVVRMSMQNRSARHYLAQMGRARAEAGGGGETVVGGGGQALPPMHVPIRSDDAVIVMLGETLLIQSDSPINEGYVPETAKLGGDWISPKSGPTETTTGNVDGNGNADAVSVDA